MTLIYHVGLCCFCSCSILVYGSVDTAAQCLLTLHNPEGCPVLCLKHSSRYLFAGLRNGAVMVYGRSDSGKVPPRLFYFIYLLFFRLLLFLWPPILNARFVKYDAKDKKYFNLRHFLNEACHFMSLCVVFLPMQYVKTGCFKYFYWLFYWLSLCLPFVMIFAPAVRMKITLHHVVDGMPCLVKHCTRPRGVVVGGFNTISAVVCSIRSQREHNSSITGLFLPGHGMSMCLTSSCAPLASQAERMINYTKLLHAD